MLSVKKSFGLSDFADAKILRQTVFVEEQGFQNEFDDVDSHAFHVVLYEGEMPIATGRTFLEGDFWHIGRIAVLKPYRGRQLGKSVMSALEEIIAENGGKRITLSAQLQAQGFYARLGYSPEGEPYPDEHCLHIAMIKKLK